MQVERIRRKPLDAIERARWRVGEAVHRGLADGRRVGRDEGLAHWGRTPDPGSVRPGHEGGVGSHRPFRPRPLASAANPVLTVADVHDYGDAEFVADPFLFASETDGWNLFFEVYNRDRTPTGVIGHATSGDAGRSWTYTGVVLRDEVHLAFPYVFEWNGSYFMIPDRWNRERAAPIRVFRTDSLPDGWRPVSTVVAPDRQLADCVAFRWNDRWWALLGSDDGRYELEAYYTDDLLADGWTPHDDNPVVSGRPTAARPAGRPIVGEDSVLVFFQDCAAQYGDRVRAYEIDRLAPDEYADSERPESPILEGTGRALGWNGGRMHHVDPWDTGDGWLCAVDGNVGLGRRAFGPNHWAIGMFRA
ncbi:hypothetical protein NGM10_16730 (plasmid) [Halorussus salilacus]|uniref:glucosamine inositolphosphorylceramide transferase family protein n=1 Tax=Halorussus salilacus TaxID=2953750 RepID=UPI00209CF814|nr:hypothetical protein [Halorussus salilacus]USZ69743.1 hypothetical protein NGM10_16730 [Halorussus salilacus]